MSVGYVMEFSVAIKGDRKDIQQIPAVARQVVSDYKAAMEQAQKEGKFFWDSAWNYEDIAKELTEIAQAALEEGEEPYVIQLESSDGDDTHGDFEDFLDGLDKRLPDLAIAVYVTYVDTEYGGGDESSVYFSPPGSSHFALGGSNTGCLMESDQLPDEDWIPYGWRHAGETPPAAKAQGEVELLGDWPEEERAMIGQALPGALEAMGYTAFDPEKEAVSPAEQGWQFQVGGAMDAGETAQHLHLALAPYAAEHSQPYAALCQAMRRKKLAIHLYLDESTGPNAAWSYDNHNVWHFLITSDGEKLVSNFTWCGTYSFGCRGGADYSQIYTQSIQKTWEDLSEEQQFLAAQAIEAYNAQNGRPQFPDIPEWVWDSLEDEDEWDDEEYEDEKQQLAQFEAEMEQYCRALAPVIEQALAKAPPPPPARYLPQTFDQRFAGKTFVVRGDLSGYEKGQVKGLIQSFGGKIGRNITSKTDYFVCGSGVGDPFKTALKHKTPLLSADYFEDMTR